MDKYDFDFKNIVEELYRILRIKNPTNIIGLKRQIAESLKALSDSLDRKVKDPNNEKIVAQKKALYRELEAVEDDNNLDSVLEKCIINRKLTLLSLEYKLRLGDSPEERERKRIQRNEIMAITDLAKSVPSFSEFMEHRRIIEQYTDTENRIVEYSKVPSEAGALADDNSYYPGMKLNIQLHPNPNRFPPEQAEALEQSGIYAYNFGEVTYASVPDRNGRYTQELSRKCLIGIIKKDEFGELKKYSVLMNPVLQEVPPEFLSDILFSDMLLRNAQNNLGYLGNIESNPEGTLYNYRVSFNDVGLSDMLRAIYFENDPNMVLTTSNFDGVKSVSDAYALMQEKMEKAIQELFEDKGQSIGDD